MTTDEIHIDVEDLTMAYGDFVIQRELNFVIKQGDVFIIMGGSGCGKSTLLKHLIGLLKPAAGRFRYKGQSYTLNLLWDVPEELEYAFHELHSAPAAGLASGDGRFCIRRHRRRDGSCG